MAGSGSGGSAGVAWAALLLALAALGFAIAGGRTSAPPEGEYESEADLASAENLDGRLMDVERRLEALEGRVGKMEPRLDAAERTADAALGEARRAGAPQDGALTVVPGGAGTVPTEDAAKREELDRLVASIRTGTFSAEGAFALMERARALGGLDEALKAMEAWARSHATEASALVNLGLAYSSKLLSVPDGPERGEWATKALQSYEDALKIDPEHWDAQFHRAFNLAQWPAFMNRQPEAIKAFETLVETQERAVPEAKHAQTYIQLGNAYRAAGNVEKALEAYRRGLTRYPENATLREQVDLMEKR